MLEGKVVLIAGVGEGLGRETAEVAYRKGAQVVLGARRFEVVEQVADSLDGTRQRALPVRLDVTDQQACADFAAAAVEAYGKVDVLVNLAAFDSVFGGVEGADWDGWRQMIEVNLFGSM